MPLQGNKDIEDRMSYSERSPFITQMLVKLLLLPGANALRPRALLSHVWGHEQKTGNIQINWKLKKKKKKIKAKKKEKYF